MRQRLEESCHSQSPTPKSKSPVIKSYVNKKQIRNINLQDQNQLQESKTIHSFKSLQVHSKFPNSVCKSKSPVKIYDSVNDIIHRTKKQIESNQKSNPNKNQKLFQKVIFYSNQHTNELKHLNSFRVQAFFNDSTSVSWKNQTLVFLSSKAIKTRVNIADLYRSDDLSFKFIQIIQNLRNYNDFYLVIQEKLKKKIYNAIENSKLIKKHLVKDLLSSKEKQPIFKKYKIQEFYWEKCRIHQIKEGYEIESNDQNAKITLQHDLFRIKVEYLQSTNGRKVKGSKNIDSDNEDSTLDKYTFHPPLSIDSKKKKKTENEIWYEYHKVQKQFSVFNLPEQWFYPIDQIWTYLLANKIIKHDFIYIDFLEQDITLTKTTQMPQCLVIGQKANQDLGDDYGHQISSLPLYGKPTHNEKCKWIAFQYQPENQQQKNVERIMWLNSESEQNLFFDGYGFWKSSSDGNSVLYKTKNCFDTVVKHHFGAIPMTLRLPHEPQRSLQSSLGIFNNYIEHNKKLENNLISEQQKNLSINSYHLYSTNSDEVIFDENLPEIGHFKVYGDGTIVGKFIDRTMLTLKGENVTIIDDLGETLTININKKQLYADQSLEKNVRNPYVRYREHLRYIADFYERFFHFDEWRNKQQLLQGLSDLKIANQAFLNVCQNIKRT